MVKNLNKILSVLCVLVMTATVFSAIVTNVSAEKNTEIDGWNSDVAISADGYVHVVWQERVFEETPEILYEDIYPTNDAYIHSLDYNANYGSEQNLYVGLDLDCDTMSYLKFDLSTLKNVTNAVLYLYQTAGAVEDVSRGLRIHPVSSEWNEDVITWSTFPDYGRTIYTILGNECVEGGKWHAVDITELVKKWTDNEIPNYGIVMECDSSFGYVVFSSKETEQMPYIKIAYEAEQKLMNDYEIFYANNLTGAYNSEINTAIQKVQGLIENATDKKLKSELEKALKELNKTLANATANDYQHSFKHLQHAVERLDKKDLSNNEIIVALVDSVMNITKVNILYREYQNISANHITKAWENYEKALERVNEEKYDKAVNEFRKAFKEAYKIDDNCEDEECNKKTESGVDFGRIVRISYTDYDSIYPKLFLNGTISVGWIEILPEGNHTSYARSEDGLSWWYFDATEYASTYLCYAGVDPSMLSIENILTITRTLERIWILDRCHYFYAPIIRDGFTIEDRRVYAPLNDPYLTIYDGKYEPILIGDKKFYIICGGPHPLPPPKAPDLTISYIAVSPETPIEGYKPNITITITNQGDASASNVTARLTDNLNRTVNIGLSNLAAKSSFQARISPWPWDFPAGVRILIAIADPNNNIPEGDENNNILAKAFNTFTSTGDEDKDGLTNYNEVYIYKTSLLNPDTDSDGLWDGYNVTIKNITYIGELSIKTNNLNPDTDGDGIDDGEEFLRWKTNPRLIDTDEDGLTDYEEIGIYGTGPLNPDSDNDGILDKYDDSPIKVINKGIYKTINEGEITYLSGIDFELGGIRYYWDTNNDSEFDAVGNETIFYCITSGEHEMSLTIIDSCWCPIRYIFSVIGLPNKTSTTSEKESISKASTNTFTENWANYNNWLKNWQGSITDTIESNKEKVTNANKDGNKYWIYSPTDTLRNEHRLNIDVSGIGSGDFTLTFTTEISDTSKAQMGQIHVALLDNVGNIIASAGHADWYSASISPVREAFIYGTTRTSETASASETISWEIIRVSGTITIKKGGTSFKSATCTQNIENIGILVGAYGGYSFLNYVKVVTINLQWTQSNTDIDPLTNLQLSINIKRIKQIDPVDVGTDGDFYVKVWVGGLVKKSSEPIKKDCNDFSPNLVFTWDVSDYVENIPVGIQLWDDDFLYDDKMDISKTGSGCDITYTLKRGSWSGDDAVGDSNGYGYVDGNEDGSTGSDEDDCALWFDVYQNDGDGDGLTYWEEMNVYGTSTTTTNRRYAILVGINDYQYISDLPYSINGVNDWKKYLEERKWTISYTLTDSQATETNIKNAISNVKAGATSNDLILLMFAGHGHKYSEVGISGTGSVLTCYDGSYTSGTTGNFQDTELQSAFSGYTGKLFIFLESCRSGGMDEVVTLDTNTAKRYMTTPCTADGFGYQRPAYQSGIWTYWFLKKGVVNGESGCEDMEGNFNWAKDRYFNDLMVENQYPANRPQQFDGDTTKLFYLWW